MRAGCRLRRASAVLDARFHLKASSISSAVQRLETPKRWRLVRRQSDGQALRRERRFARCPALTGGAADRWAGVGAGGGAWLASRVPPARAAARWPRTWLASKRAPDPVSRLTKYTPTAPPGRLDGWDKCRDGALTTRHRHRFGRSVPRISNPARLDPRERAWRPLPCMLSKSAAG